MSNKIYNACIYARLSRDDGDKLESDSITNQKFWQMVGRGTRLCPGLMDGEDKGSSTSLISAVILNFSV